MDPKGSFTFARPGRANGPQGFVCVYEKAWGADEEPAEGVWWQGGHVNEGANVNGLQGIWASDGAWRNANGKKAVRERAYKCV